MSKNKPVVIFDIGRVIIDFDLHLMSSNFARVSNRPQKEIYDYILSSGIDKTFDKGEISPQDFYQRILSVSPMDITYEQFVKITCEIFSRKPETEDIILSLKDSCRLSLLSNINKLHYDYIMKTYPVLSLFEDRLLSFEMGLLKPDKKIYQKVMDFYKTDPQELFYTDDLPENVAAAKELGFNAFVFTSAEQLTEDLARSGIRLPKSSKV